MKKDELLMFALDNDLEVEESMTKEEIKNMILDAGIDDDVVEPQAEDPDINEPAETNDEVLIRMMRPTKHYSYGRYKFTREDPFAIMKKEDAEAILDKNGNAFRKASEAEIRKFFA